MAKRQKTTRFSIQSFDNKHYRTTEQYTRAVDALFDAATKAISKAATKGNFDPDKPFSFNDYPSVKAIMQDVSKQLASRLTTVIETGSRKQWLFACKKNDGFIESIMDTSKLSKARLKKMQDRNLDALQTFQQRKVDGMNLSQRVWKYVGQYKEQIESALDVGLGEGRSAQQLARDVKKNLKDPNRLFRRVRDKRGNLVLSKAARAFHPGRGVYRSSYKNAMRLTRSEINMAYRESDYLRWQQLDFIVGFEVHRSNHEPLCKCAICSKLVGCYPKTFKFVGWHPQCMCYAIPILMDDETFDDNELGDLKAALRGTTYQHKQAANVVPDVPQGFKDWVKDHIEAQKKWASTPYFIRDNFKNGNLADGLKIALPTIPAIPKIDPIQAQLDALLPQVNAALTIAGTWNFQTSAKILRNAYDVKNVPDVKKLIDSINKLAKYWQSRLDGYISKATPIITEAKNLGIDTTAVEDTIRNLKANPASYVNATTQNLADKILEELKRAIDAAKNNGALSDVAAKLEKKKVEHREVKDLQKELTTEQIIERLGGGDLTSGSCSSLAFAYAANRGKLDVLDFRGGESMDFFSSTYNIREIVKKVGGLDEYNVTGVEMMRKTEIGKEYYLAIGRHAAIVRQVSKGKYEYLELQSSYSNGWHSLNAKKFAWRFSARGREWSAQMCEVSLLFGDKSFRKLMGYINTAEENQKKGKTGTIK